MHYRLPHRNTTAMVGAIMVVGPTTPKASFTMGADMARTDSAPFTRQIAATRIFTALTLLAVAASAFGAMAIGALAVGRLKVGQGRIDRLTIDDLEVGRLRVRELIVDNQ
jgi:hypothetical protein